MNYTLERIKVIGRLTLIMLIRNVDGSSKKCLSKHTTIVQLIDVTLAPKALRVVLRQSGRTINSSPHRANHCMFGFNFITLVLLRYRCHI